MIGYSPEKKGGVETYVSILGRYLSDEFEIIHRENIMNIDGKIWIMPLNRHNYLKYWLFWTKFFRENHFDAIYFNTCDLLSIDALKFTKSANVPVRIIHSHSADDKVWGKGLMLLFHTITERLSRKNLHKYATHLLACSQRAGEWMFDGRPFIIIKNGVDLQQYKFSEEKRSKIAMSLKNPSKKVIACIGRLSSVKNPFFSLEIFKKACEIDKDVQCIFIGDGEHRAKLERLVKEAGLEGRIIFTGAVENVNEWLSYMTALLMPSLFEGLPFALVEAQAAGIHALVSDTVSQESNITGLVEYKSLSDSTESWAKRIIELAELPRVDVSAKLEEAGFSIEKSAQIVKDILENA